MQSLRGCGIKSLLLFIVFPACLWLPFEGRKEKRFQTQLWTLCVSRVRKRRSTGWSFFCW